MLLLLVAGVVPNIVAIAVAGKIPVIIKAMRRHCGDIGLTCLGCKALFHLAGFNASSLQAVKAAGGIAVAKAAVKNHPAAKDVQKESKILLDVLQ